VWLQLLLSSVCPQFQPAAADLPAVVAAVVKHGFKNNSLYVHRDVTVAAPCYGPEEDLTVAGCARPPIVNPANGAMVQTCTSWYLNRSDVMVKCPIQDKCCSDECLELDDQDNYW
jgi:hypothetical protein